MDKILFYEDCYRQIEILPQESYNHCIQQANIALAFQEDHSRSLGYSDALERQSPPYTIDKKKISKSTLDACLQTVPMTRKEVFSEYDDFSEPCQNIFAYANIRNITLFFEEQSDIITNIWLNLDVKSGEDYHVAEAMLLALTSLGNLIIADWGWGFVESLGNKDCISEYLYKRLKVFTTLC